jgi:1-pyrroline-5-carboxylate dehydrogenase
MIIPPFHNEPNTDFTIPAERQAFESALQRVTSRVGARYPLWIGAREVTTTDWSQSLNPACPSQVVGTHAMAGPAEVDAAVAAAAAAYRTWSRTTAEERAALLLRAAAAVRRRRHDLSALMVLEAGKSWDEADGETSEVIDLMEWYARQTLRLAHDEGITPLPGEILEYRYLPLGVGAIISPWNFPLALLTGMMTGALATGNTVVVKPASATSICAAWLLEVFRDVHVPDGVINLCTGRGDVVGDALVGHPGVRFVAFTGSREVGLRIYEHAARASEGQRWLKKVQLELGGKNAVVVDETADLDRAAREIVISAFGFQGQKCSAGSRAILIGDTYDEMVERVLAGARELRVGDPADPSVDVGPLIDAGAERKVLGYVEVGRSEAKLLLGGRKLDREGYFIEPTIFGDVPSSARIAQEEIFGPVLSIIRAKDVDEAIEIANGTEYGLTGSFFSRDPAHIAQARATFHAGNLYINRKSTGALMGVHPFGGFNMSGTDTKAGGPDYLLFFVQAQAIGERL